jgi:hypothetical protein
VRAASLIGASLVSVLLLVGLGWGPAEVATHPERLALVGLAVAGLIWPVVVLRLAGRYRGVDDSEL